MTRIRLDYVHEFLDRHGRVRRYFRRSGFRQVPLPGLPGSAEFMEAYQAALSGETTPRIEIGAGRAKPGTVRRSLPPISTRSRSETWRPRHSAVGAASSNGSVPSTAISALRC